MTLAQKEIRGIHPELFKSLQELDKWAPPQVNNKPPGLRTAPADSQNSCVGCTYFTGKLGLSWKGAGICTKFKAEVKENQTCKEFSQ